MICLSHDVCFQSLHSLCTPFSAASDPSQPLIQVHRDGQKPWQNSHNVPWPAHPSACLGQEAGSLRCVTAWGQVLASALVLPSRDVGPPSTHSSSRLRAGSDVRRKGGLRPEPASFAPRPSLSGPQVGREGISWHPAAREPGGCH